MSNANIGGMFRCSKKVEKHCLTQCIPYRQIKINHGDKQCYVGRCKFKFMAEIAVLVSKLVSLAETDISARKYHASQTLVPNAYGYIQITIHSYNMSYF